jgi:alpha-L-fucosidase
MLMFRFLAVCILCVLSLCELSAQTTASWSNPLVKQGYLNSPLVESSPFVFNNRLYLLESWYAYFDIPDVEPGTSFHESVARIRDVATDEIVTTAMDDCEFATAFVWDGRVYVFAGRNSPGKPWRQITRIQMTSSSDLKTWTEPVTVLEAEGDELLWNTAICRANGKFYLLYETNDSRWPAFTFRYCVSNDLQHWSRIEDGIYGADRYVGGPALYHEGDWFYTLYLESLGEGKYETRIARSKDLKTWNDAPAGRPFVTYDPSRTNMPRRPANLPETNASDAEACFFDGKTIVYYTGGDQQKAGDLQRATYNGSMRELFEHFFE